MREVGNFFFLTSSQLWWLYLGAQIVWKMWERNINCKHGTALLSQPTLFIIEIKNACILCFRSDLILTLPGKQLPIPTVFLKQTKVGLIYSESQINHILYNTHTHSLKWPIPDTRDWISTGTGGFLYELITAADQLTNQLIKKIFFKAISPFGNVEWWCAQLGMACTRTIKANFSSRKQ